VELPAAERKRRRQVRSSFRFPTGRGGKFIEALNLCVKDSNRRRNGRRGDLGCRQGRRAGPDVGSPQPLQAKNLYLRTRRASNGQSSRVRQPPIHADDAHAPMNPARLSGTRGDLLHASAFPLTPPAKPVWNPPRRHNASADPDPVQASELISAHEPTPAPQSAHREQFTDDPPGPRTRLGDSDGGAGVGSWAEINSDGLTGSGFGAGVVAARGFQNGFAGGVGKAEAVE